MNLQTANAKQVTSFISEFLKNKELDKSSFSVQHPFYGQTDMPFSVVKDALTTTDQNLNFLRESAIIMSSLDFQNASTEKFRVFFQKVASTLISAV